MQLTEQCQVQDGVCGIPAPLYLNMQTEFSREKLPQLATTVASVGREARVRERCQGTSQSLNVTCLSITLNIFYTFNLNKLEENQHNLCPWGQYRAETGPCFDTQTVGHTAVTLTEG